MDLRETVLALFCDPEGEPCFHGSDGDRAVLKAVLSDTRKADCHEELGNEADHMDSCDCCQAFMKMEAKCDSIDAANKSMIEATEELLSIIKIIGVENKAWAEIQVAQSALSKVRAANLTKITKKSRHKELVAALQWLYEVANVADKNYAAVTNAAVVLARATNHQSEG